MDKVGSDKCEICYRSIAEEAEMQCQTCSRVLHMNCVNELLKKSDTCPVCKGGFTLPSQPAMNVNRDPDRRLDRNTEIAMNRAWSYGSRQKKQDPVSRTAQGSPNEFCRIHKHVKLRGGACWACGEVKPLNDEDKATNRAYAVIYFMSLIVYIAVFVLVEGL